MRLPPWPAGRARELGVVTVVLAAIVCVSFPQVVFGGRTFAPNGRLAGQSGAPRVDYPYETPMRAVVNDAGAFAWFFEPTATTVHAAYSSGAAPLWNPYAGLGVPLAADLQSAPAAPFYWPLFIHPSQKVWDLVALLRLLLGGIGCYALVRALGARPAAAFVPAVGYLLASAYVLWILSVSMSVEALVPWVLLAVLAVLRTGGPARFAALAAAVAAAALGGQPESLVVLAYLATAWAVYWWLREGRSPRSLAELAGAALAGALVAAPQLLLAARYIPDAVDAHAGRLGEARLTFDAFGDVLLGDFAAKEQGAVAIGLVVLAAAGLVGRMRGSGVLIGVTLLWAVRALDLPGARVVGALPGIDAVNVRRYGLFVIVLTAAVLAAAGLEEVLRGAHRPLFAAAAGAALPLLLWALGAPRDNALPALAIGLVLALGTTVAWRAPQVAPALAAVLFVQFLLLTPRSYAREYNPFAPEPFVAFLRDRLAPGERVAGLGNILRPQYPSAMSVPDLRVEDALYPERYEHYMSGLVGARPAQRSSFAGYLTREQTASPFLAAAAVRYVVAPRRFDSLGPGYRAVFRSASRRGPVVWENENAFPRAWLVGQVVAVTDEASAQAATAGAADRLRATAVVENPTEEMSAARGAGTASVAGIEWNDIRYVTESKGPALLVSSDLVSSGWTATVDGRSTPIRPANVAMRAVAVPGGKHEVTFRYRPSEFRYGLALALLGLALVGGRSLATAVRASR